MIQYVFQSYCIFYNSAGSANIQKSYFLSHVMGVLCFYIRPVHAASIEHQRLLLREAEAQQCKVSHKQLHDRLVF